MTRHHATTRSLDGLPPDLFAHGAAPPRRPGVRSAVEREQSPESFVAVAVHDGFYGCGTGAGWCNRALLEVLAETLPETLELVVMPIRVEPSSPGYDGAWHAAMQDLVSSTGGHVMPIENGSGGRARFGRLKNFRLASINAADAVTRRSISARSDFLFFAVDVPFFGVGLHLPPALLRHLVVVAQGAGAVHSPGDRTRLAWERQALGASVAGGARVAATSAAMRKHLVGVYGLPSASVVDLPNGLLDHDYEPMSLAFAPTLPPLAAAGFVFAMGRAEEHKGFDDLLDAVVLLRESGMTLPHLVVAAVTDDGTLNDYQRHLAERILKEDLDATLWTRYLGRMRALLGHPGLRAVVVPSRVEPFGRIPLEAYVAGVAPVVATTAGGLAELVVDEVTGFTASPYDPTGLANALRRALEADGSTIEGLRIAGRELAERYNYSRTVRRFLASAAPWIGGPSNRPTQYL